MTSPDSRPVNTGTARRPSLFEQPAGRARTPHREIAVLAPFATQKPAQTSVRWATAGVAAVASAFALLAGATLWAMFNGGNAEQAPPPKVVHPATKAAPAAAPLVAVAQQDTIDATSASATVLAVAPPSAALVDTAPIADVPAASKRTETPPPAAIPPAETTGTQVRHQASSAAPKPTPQAAEKKPKAPKKAKPKGEADTALLAALVSHIDHTAAQNANRDVVGTNLQQGNTAELVARCDRLGGLEGTLCRKRICKGLWGTDPACPGR